MLAINACVKVKNPQGHERMINKGDKDGSVLLDLRYSSSVKGFKEHVMQQVKLAESQSLKYLMWVFLAKNEKKLTESKYSQVPNAILTDLDLREVIMAALHLDAYMVVTLEKFSANVSRPSFVVSGNQKSARKKKELEFDLEGQV